MARRLWLPPPEDPPQRPPWYQLTSEDRIEELKARTDGQDRRLERIEGMERNIRKLVWVFLTAVLGVLAKEYVSSYQLVRTGQTILPPPTGVPSIAPDYPKTGPRPGGP